MKLTFKKYKITKIKSYIKTNNFFLFLNGINLNYNQWVFIEQNLQSVNFNYYKINNKISIKTLNTSIYKNITSTINSVIFLIDVIEPYQELKKQVILNHLNQLFFNILAINLNNHIYSKNQVQHILSLNYKTNKLLFYKFQITNLKFIAKNK